jgi:hypothetical protein
MSTNKVFKDNALFLQQHLRMKDSHIADIAQSKGKDLTKSYVGKVLNSAKVANITLDKVDAFAAAFNQRPIDLLNPLGFDEDGNPKGVDHLLNIEVLEQSVLEVDEIVQQTGVTEKSFKAKAIALVYAHKVSGDDANLPALLTQLLKSDGS